MYGRKKQRGEQYYHESRKYVEVSDVVYCERELFSLTLGAHAQRGFTVVNPRRACAARVTVVVLAPE